MASSLLDAAVAAQSSAAPPADADDSSGSALLSSAVRARGSKHGSLLGKAVAHVSGSRATSSHDDPFRGVKAIAGGAKAVAGSVLSPAMDLLGRPGVATQALLSGKGGIEHLGSDLARAGSAFVHGVSPEDQEANRDTIKRGLHVKGLVDKLPAGLMRGTADAAIDTGLDPTTYLGGMGLIEKAVNAVGRGAIVGGVKGADAIGKHLITKADRSGDLERQLRDRRNVSNVGQVIGAAHDALTPGGMNVGAAKRALIARKGYAGLDDHAIARQIDKVGQNTRAGVQNELTRMYKASTHGLNEADEDAVNIAVDRGTIAKLKPELQPHADGVKRVFQSLMHLQGAGSVRKDLADTGFQLPAELEQFDTSVRGLQKRGQVRANYMPHAPALTEEERALLAHSENIEGAGLTEDDLYARGETEHTAKLRSALDAKDAHLKARETMHLGLQDVGRQRAINIGRIASGARAIAARDTSREVARTFAPGREIMRTKPGEPVNVGEIYRAAISGVSDDDKAAINKALSHYGAGSRAALEALAPQMRQRAESVLDATKFRPTGTQVGTGKFAHRLDEVPHDVKLAFKPGDVPKDGVAATIGEGLKAATTGAKAAMFLNPTRHMFNVSMLAGLEDPVSMATAAARYIHGGTMLPDFIKPLWQKIPGSHEAANSQARAIAVGIKAGAVNVNPEHNIPYLIDKVPYVRELFRWSGDTLWSYDDAQKATRYDSLLKKTGYETASAKDKRRISALAAQRVGAQLIDYGDKSELTKKLAYIAPFATYRSKLPGAIARSVANHPERALALGRVSPALTGQRVDAGDGDTATSALPLGDVLNMSAAPEKYLRSTLGAPAKDTLSLLGAGSLTPGHPRAPTYMTYGREGHPNPPDWKIVLGQYLSPLMGADQVLDALGANEFDPQSFQESLVSGSTGAYVQKPQQP